MMRLVPFAFSVDQKFIERERKGERERDRKVSITRLVCWLSSIAAPSKCNLQLPHAQTIYLPALTNKRGILESSSVPPNERHLPGVLQIKKSAKTRQVEAGWGARTPSQSVKCLLNSPANSSVESSLRVSREQPASWIPFPSCASRIEFPFGEKPQKNCARSSNKIKCGKHEAPSWKIVCRNVRNGNEEETRRHMEKGGSSRADVLIWL